MHYGEEQLLLVKTAGALAVDRVAILRNSSVTHATDFQQTYVELLIVGEPALLPGDIWEVRVQFPDHSWLAEQVEGVAIDPSDNIVVVGTAGTGWPTTPGVVQPAFSGGSVEGFVTKFPPDCSRLLFSTYFGTASVTDVHVDGSGVLTLAGTGSIPTTPNTFDSVPKGLWVARLSSDATTQLYGSYLGGSFLSWISGVHADDEGAITVCGNTLAGDFPSTHNAFDPTFSGNPSVWGDGFITRISPAGNTLEFSTFLGGLGDDGVHFMAVDSAGSVTVVGGTDHNVSFPTTAGSLQPGPDGLFPDAGGFVARLHHSGSRLLYSSFLLKTGTIFAFGAPGLALDDEGAAVVGGNTIDAELPVTRGSFDSEFNPGGFFDGFVMKLTMLPLGVERFGASTPGPQGPLAIGALAMPQLGSQDFGLTSTNGPHAAGGLLVVGTAALAQPVGAAGAALWLDPARLLALLPVTSNEKGYSEQRLALSPNPALEGAQAFFQYFWPGNPGGGYSASNALEVTLQP